MADKKKFQDVPKAEHAFSNPNELKDLLEDLDAYEDRKDEELAFQSTDGGRYDTVKNHKPADRLPEVYKKHLDVSIEMENIRPNPGEQVGKDVKKELEKAHEDAPFAAIRDLPEVHAMLDIAAIERVIGREI
jgi:hypothetical protein